MTPVNKRTIIAENTNRTIVKAREVVDMTFEGSGPVVDEIANNLNNHVINTVIHVTQINKDSWDAKAEFSDIPVNFDNYYYRKQTIDDGFSTINQSLGSFSQSISTITSDLDGLINETNSKFVAVNNEIIAIESDIDVLQAASHGHTNKTILDNTTASFTSGLKTIYDSAVTKEHEHANKTLLDGLTSDNVVSQTAITSALAGKEPTINKLSAFNTAFGTADGTTCEGNDSRLENKREPLPHEQAETSITFTDVTTGNASTTKHGYLPKLDGDANKFLNGLGVFAVPAGGGGGSTYWENLQGLPTDNDDLLALFSEYYNKTEIDNKGFALSSDIPTNFDDLYYKKTETQTTSEIETALSGKVNVDGTKVLSANDFTDTLKTKLDGIEAEANNYVHPATHAPSIIEQDINNRFVTDAEKSTWNAKSNFSGSYTDLTNTPTLFDGDYTSLTNKPTIPTTLASLNDDATHRLTTDSEKTTWNGKQDALGFTPENGTNKATVLTTSNDTLYPTVKAVVDGLATKQATLVSNTNIKTVNSNSLLGSGNIAVQATLVSGTNIKTVGGTSILGNGDIPVGGDSVNIETLSATKTLVATDVKYQRYTTTASRAVNLPTTGVVAGKIFNIYNNADGATPYVLTIKQGSTTIDIKCAQSNGEYIWDGTNWRKNDVGSGDFTTNNQLSISIGYDARSYDTGASVGYKAYSFTNGAAVGYNSNGSTNGAAVGYGANGSTNGAAVGYNSNGSTGGVAVGSVSKCQSKGAGTVALGFYAQVERADELVKNACNSNQKNLYLFSMPIWYSTDLATTTATEIFLDGASARYTLLSSEVANFRLQASCICTTGTNVGAVKTWEVIGCIKNIAGTVSFVGTPSVNLIAGDAVLATATFSVEADNTNKSLKPVVTGTTDTLRWSIVGYINETRY